MEGRGKVFAGGNWELSVRVFRGKPDLTGPGIISTYTSYGEIFRITLLMERWQELD